MSTLNLHILLNKEKAEIAIVNFSILNNNIAIFCIFIFSMIIYDCLLLLMNLGLYLGRFLLQFT